MKGTKYITTTLPYVNSDPHIGHALEIVQADTYARFFRDQGYEVFFNTGTDEHGVKVYDKAIAEGKDPKSYTDEYAAKFDSLRAALDLSYDNFIRTTDPEHMAAAQEFWKLCLANGDIEKRQYAMKYCNGCELEKTDSELVHGECPEHPGKELATIEEENYFFKLSNYKDKLLNLYQNQAFVFPEARRKEAVNLVQSDAFRDFSISRLKTKMPWGISVPGDDEHVMYVWFDALVNYISAIGWPNDMGQFEKFWPVVQFAGKDQVRPQIVMWQAMLYSAGLAPSKQLMIHGFINNDGVKMSKSIGNVVSPYELVEKYGTDSVRYYLLRHVHPFDDSDYSDEKFHEAYTANLVNGLGNLVSRTMKMIESYDVDISDIDVNPDDVLGVFSEHIESFEFHKMMDDIWKHIGELDQFIADNEPYKKVKVDTDGAHSDLRHVVIGLVYIAKGLVACMPATAEKILQIIASAKSPAEPLFPRI